MAVCSRSFHVACSQRVCTLVSGSLPVAITVCCIVTPPR